MEGALRALSGAAAFVVPADIVRADLVAKGTPTGPYDLRTAAVALAKDLTPVTRNVDEFRRVEGIEVEGRESPG